MYVPQRTPSDRPVSASNRVLVYPELWLLLIAVGVGGCTTWAAFLYIGIRARRRSWVAWAIVYGALTVLWLVIINSTTNSIATGIGAAAALIAWIGGGIHAAAIRETLRGGYGLPTDPGLRQPARESNSEQRGSAWRQEIPAWQRR
jgi:hypothetical protein